jgi:hypothetical protein
MAGQSFVSNSGSGSSPRRCAVPTVQIVCLVAECKVWEWNAGFLLLLGAGLVEALGCTICQQCNTVAEQASGTSVHSSMGVSVGCTGRKHGGHAK